ncbi:MAG TPA: hypothetical protein VGV67_00210, partial [Solirubrobacteraceae bacterium]|nr:hypothetical protein [Solirubrobacteraceae bacterium]
AVAAELASTDGAHGFADAEYGQVPTLTDDAGGFGEGAEPQLAAGLVLLVAGLAGVGVGLAAGRPRTPSDVTAAIATT